MYEFGFDREPTILFFLGIPNIVTWRMSHIFATQAADAGDDDEDHEEGGGEGRDARAVAVACEPVYYTGYNFEKDEAWRAVVGGQKEFSKLHVNGDADPDKPCKFKWGDEVLEVPELTVGEYAGRTLANLTPRGCTSPYLWESFGVNNTRLWITRRRDRDPIFVLYDNGKQVLCVP